MSKALSVDLRDRVIAAIEDGMSCRQAAAWFGVSASSAIRWRSRLRTQGDVRPGPLGGDRRSGRIERHADVLLGLVERKSDITLDDYDWDETTGLLVSVTAPTPTSGATRPQTRFTHDDVQARYRDSATTWVNGSAIWLPVEVSACATGTSCDGAANEVQTTITYPTTASANNLLPVSTFSGSGATPATATTAMTYTAAGDIATVDGPLSGTADTVTYIYNTAGNDIRQVIGIIGPDPDGGGTLLNRAQRLTYNSRGQVTLAETGTASGGVWANFSALLKSQTTYDAGQFFRPVEARQLSGAGAVSGVQSVSYDAAGRPSCTAVRMNPTTFTALPSSACTAATTGGFGPDRIAQTTYDAINRVVSTTSAYGPSDSLTESVAYTANGRAAALTDGRGNVSLLEYDGFDRLVKLRYPNATGGGTSTTDYEAWTWNAAGQPNTSRNRAGGTTGYSWDLLSRLTDVAPPSGTSGSTAGFDNLGRQTSISTVPSSITVSTAYDALSRPVSQSTTDLGSMLYSYDAASRLTRMEWPDGFQAEYAHDLYGATTGIDQHVPPASPVALAAYGYDNLSQLAGVTRNGGSGASSAYGYDAFARLTSLAHNASGTGDDLTLGYGYNPAGQIVGSTVSDGDYVWTPATGGTSYSLNGLNQATAVGGVSVTYDSNQNATGVTGNSYGYDAAGRLTSATPSGGSAAGFGFDPLDRLASSTVSSTTTRYQYAGQQLATEYDASGAVTRRYVPGLGLDGVVTAYTGSGVGTRDWLLADERGSVLALTGSTGVVGTINKYDEYGVPNAANAGRFGYTGQAWLAEAAAWNYRARAYLPGVGRFLQPDPIGYAAGANLYGYVGADPVTWVDPWGLQEEPAELDDVIVNACARDRHRDRFRNICARNVTRVIIRVDPSITGSDEQPRPIGGGTYGCYAPTPSSYYVAPSDGGGQVRLPAQLPGTTVRFQGAGAKGADGISLGWATGSFQYLGVNGVEYQGTFTSYSIGIGAGGSIGGFEGVAPSLDQFFRWSNVTSGQFGPAQASVSGNPSGGSVAGGLGGSIGSRFTNDFSYTVANGNPAWVCQ